jgi:hypothetical protein
MEKLIINLIWIILKNSISIINETNILSGTVNFIWLEPSEISVNGDFDFLENLKIEGSSSHTVFEKYNLLLAGATKQIDSLKRTDSF